MWEPPGTTTQTPEHHRAVMLASALVRDLGALDARIAATIDASTWAHDAAVGLLRTQAEGDLRRSADGLRDRLADIAASLGSMPMPLGRPGARSFEDGSWTRAPRMTLTVPGLLRIGTVRTDPRVGTVPAFVPSLRNLEIRSAPGCTQRAGDLLRALVLRQLVDLDPGLQRVVVIDQADAGWRMREFAAMLQDTAADIVVSVFGPAQAMRAVDELARRVHDLTIGTLAAHDSLDAFNRSAPPARREPYTMVVLPSGFRDLPGAFAAGIATLSRIGPKAGTNVVLLADGGGSSVSLHEPVTVEVTEPTRASVNDGARCSIEPVELDAAPSPTVYQGLLAALRTEADSATIAGAAPGAGWAPPTASPEPARSADPRAAWTAYGHLLGAIDDEVLAEASARLDRLQTLDAAGSAEGRRLVARRAALLAMSERATLLGRRAHVHASALAIPDPPVAGVEPPTVHDVDAAISTVEEELGRLERHEADVRSARDAAELARVAGLRAKAWAAADRQREHDKGIAHKVLLSQLMVSLGLAGVVVIGSLALVLVALVLMAIVGGVATVLIDRGALRRALHASGQWPSAYHPDDLADDAGGTVALHAQFVTGPVALATAIAGLIGRWWWRGIGAAGLLGVLIVIGAGWALYGGAVAQRRRLRAREHRFTAVRPN